MLRILNRSKAGPIPISSDRSSRGFHTIGGRCDALNNPSANGLQPQCQYSSKDPLAHFRLRRCASTPEVKTCNDILSGFVFICIQNLGERLAKSVSSWWNFGGNAHLPSTRMQHPHVLPSHDMNQFARLNMPDLNETRFERQNVGIV